MFIYRRKTNIIRGKENEMDEKTIQRIKKLQALAERGVGGEKDTAERMLQKMLERNSIKSLDELQSVVVKLFCNTCG